jgi:hypothetical protein
MAESLSPLLMERGYLHNFSRLQNIELQQFQAPSPAGEGWGEENKISWLYSIIPAFSLKGEGALTCVDTHAPEGSGPGRGDIKLKLLGYFSNPMKSQILWERVELSCSGTGGPLG